VESEGFRGLLFLQQSLDLVIHTNKVNTTTIQNNQAYYLPWVECKNNLTTNWFMTCATSLDEIQLLRNFSLINFVAQLWHHDQQFLEI
jgi:hypothetical protein